MATPVAHPATFSRDNPSTFGDDKNLVATVDDILADEMSRLSLQEKYQLDLDVRGMNLLAAIEPAELSTMGLDALDCELKTRKDNKFYRLALSLNSAMVTSHEFKLRFARAERFDPIEAVNRMEKYLELLHQGFGSPGLLRPIRMSDLDKVRKRRFGTTLISLESSTVLSRFLCYVRMNERFSNLVPCKYCPVVIELDVKS